MITSAGLVRMAVGFASTWTYIGIGTGITTTNIGDSDLESTVSPRQPIGIAVASLFTLFTKTVFQKADNNSASNITEMVVADASSAGEILFHTVASTATWTAFLKGSATAAIVSINIAVSA